MNAKKIIATEKLNRPARFDLQLCDPKITNEFTSAVQINFLMKIIEGAYYGLVYIRPMEFSIEVGTTPHTIRTITELFVRKKILEPTNTKYEFRFLYYKDMKMDMKGYVKLYSFLVISPEFQNLSLPGQRVVLYFLSQLANQSSSNRFSIPIDVSNWYSRGEERLFPFCNKYEAEAVLKEASIFFSLDLSKFKANNHILLHDLNPLYSAVHYSSRKSKWMKNFLEENRCYYYQDFHVRHLVQQFDNLVEHVGWQFAVNIWNKAILKANSSISGAEFFGKLATDQEDKQGSSDAAYFFRNTFLAEALQEEGLTVAEIFERKIEVDETYSFWKERVNGFCNLVIENYLKNKTIPSIAEAFALLPAYKKIADIVKEKKIKVVSEKKVYSINRYPKNTRVAAMPNWASEDSLEGVTSCNDADNVELDTLKAELDQKMKTFKGMATH